MNIRRTVVSLAAAALLSLGFAAAPAGAQTPRASSPSPTPPLLRRDAGDQGSQAELENDQKQLQGEAKNAARAR